VLNDRGEVTEVLCIGNDITEWKQYSESLKQAAQDLRETRDFLENLLGHANAPIVVWDPSFRITRFNHAFERLTGYRAQKVIGKPLEMLFPAASRHESLCHIRKTLSGESWEAVEIPIMRRDGIVRTVLWNSATIYDEDGKQIIATMAQGQDITERNQAREQVLFQASLLDQVRNSVIATDLQGRILYWNRFAEMLYQWKAEEVLGRGIADTIVPEDKYSLIRGVMDEIVRSGYMEGERLARRKDGSIFPAFYIFSLLKDPRGKHIGFVGVSVDLTDRKRQEEDLRLAKEKAESSARAKSEFLANMSHEIRTPMNAVIGLTGLLLNTKIDPQQREYIEIIRSSGDALLAIISDILDFSKIEKGMMELEKQPFDIALCLEASMDLVADAAARKGLSLSYVVESMVPPGIVGDPTRLRQVLVNLLSNAVKFTKWGSIQVTVSSHKVGLRHEIQFTVNDSGIGICRDRMDHLFQPFSQVDASTTRKYGGTGLGLAICKHLVELMGGSIWAESEPGIGSRFHFTITAGSAPEQGERELAGKRVLMVTKDSHLQEQLQALLGSWSMQSQFTGSCLAASRILDREGYDLIVLDLETDSLDSLRDMIRSGNKTPVLAIGGAPGQETLFPSALPKPIRASVLARSVLEALQGDRHQTGALPGIELLGGAGRKDLRILLAEDNAVNQMVALRMLERMGYQADVAANGVEVCRALERLQYDVVLMDVQMPEMDGLEATRRIRSMPELRQPYIIAMTAHAMKGDREECLEAGMNDYVSKPVRMQQLLSALEHSHTG